MAAKIIDGKEISQAVREELKHRADKLKDKGILPGLAVIIVGDNPASRVYVRNKIKACHEVGLHSESHDMPENASEEMVLNQIEELNQNPKIHGILVQLPLPAHINDIKVLEAISPDKDVDGFHYYNLGALFTGNMKFPICTSRTQDLKSHTARADILVVATGRPEMITGDMIKEGATVIDVGINHVDDGRLVGDVEFASASQRAAYITPVPGGVGPMTIAILVANTVLSAEKSSGA
jgi:methylenetetrahydrofolate dehydrogenase (NADP+)/methenyltetrahydrofolate cyclohydrolase